MGSMRLSIILCLVLSMSTNLMAKDIHVKKSDAEKLAKVGEDDESDGGFSSLDGMLQWAIGRSDASKLKETARTAQRLSPDELKQRQDGETQNKGDSEAAFHKAGDVVTSILAKGFIFGKDAINKAKSFDEKHQLTSTAFTKISSFDQKIGLTEKISMGTSAVNRKVKKIDERFQVSEKTKTSYAVAEEKVSDARSTIMNNKYVQTGATWFGDAYDRVAKVADEVGQRTREKVRMAEEERERE